MCELCKHCHVAGYDGLPVEEMQGMGINSHPGSTYGPIQDMDMGQQHFEDMPPAPPQDNNQVRSPETSSDSTLNTSIYRLLLGMTQISETIKTSEDNVLVNHLTIIQHLNSTSNSRIVDTNICYFIFLSWNFLRCNVNLCCTNRFFFI